MIKWTQMKRLLSIASALLAIAFVLLISHPASAQQPATFQYQPPKHVTADTMNMSDSAILQAHRNELAQAAKIYGYNLEQGNWVHEQTLCDPMPGTILLHYLHQFPDGTSSLFTALVPRQAGRVHIVPVLYRNAVPFVPSAKNPRNYAIFNELVSADAANKSLRSRDAGLELAVCYAELAGGRTDVPQGLGIKVAIAGAPPATIRINPQDNITQVSFASQQGDYTYRLWSVSLDKNGRVITAGSEDYAVYAPKARAQQPRIAVTTQVPTASQKTESRAANEIVAAPHGDVRSPAVASFPAQQNSAGVVASSDQSSEPGWKLITHPAQPIEKITPVAPEPPVKMIPQAPIPQGWSGSDNPSSK
jgi:hypothetical protein